MKKLTRDQVNTIIRYAIFAFITLLVVYFSYKLFLFNKKRLTLKNQVQLLEKEAIFMAQENEILKSREQEFFTNEALEREARIMLGLKKEGENVVILNKDEVIVQEQESKTNIFSNIFNFFKNIFK
ncbi:MAG: hypothetical protein PHO23_01430 [Candidatus Pacebacteria bacterium]|nr:hypothetical protein [Candidatus Paceibacterota bacterium]